MVRLLSPRSSADASLGSGCVLALDLFPQHMGARSN
jgi:hypothetical protein